MYYKIFVNCKPYIFVQEKTSATPKPGETKPMAITIDNRNGLIGTIKCPEGYSRRGSWCMVPQDSDDDYDN